MFLRGCESAFPGHFRHGIYYCQSRKIITQAGLGAGREVGKLGGDGFERGAGFGDY